MPLGFEVRSALPTGSVNPILQRLCEVNIIVPRIVVIGNAAGGKSTLARHLAQRTALPLIELDKLLWQEGWRFAAADTYARKHAAIISGGGWDTEGLGSQAT